MHNMIEVTHVTLAAVVVLCSVYLSEGFVHLESIVGKAIIRLMVNPGMTDCEGMLETDISVSMRQLPYPEYRVDLFLTVAGITLPLLLILAYIYSAGVFTKACTLKALGHDIRADCLL